MEPKQLPDLHDGLGVPDADWWVKGIPEIDDEPEDEETRQDRWNRAYIAFCSMPRKHARGWANRLANVTGIPAPNLKRWRKQHEWDLRFAGEMSALDKDLDRTAMAIARSHAGRVVERLIDIIEYGEDRDANTAIKTWTEMTGNTVRKPNTGVTLNQNLIVPVQAVQNYKELSADELFSQAKDRTQANLDAALVARSSRGRSTM